MRKVRIGCKSAVLRTVFFKQYIVLHSSCRNIPNICLHYSVRPMACPNILHIYNTEKKLLVLVRLTRSVYRYALYTYQYHRVFEEMLL